MDLLEALGHVGLFARLSLILGVAPLAVAVAYVIRPTAERLAILRPLSLASIFGALAALTAGVLAILMRLQSLPSGGPDPYTYVALSEALTVPLFNFAMLAVSWVVVTVGMLRRPPIE